MAEQTLTDARLAEKQEVADLTAIFQEVGPRSLLPAGTSPDGCLAAIVNGFEQSHVGQLVAKARIMALFQMLLQQDLEGGYEPGDRELIEHHNEQMRTVFVSTTVFELRKMKEALINQVNKPGLVIATGFQAPPR